MTLVNWGGAISIRDKKEEIPDIKNVPWVELCVPQKLSQIKGNKDQIKQINEWFTKVQCKNENEENSCLFIEGPSGVWKSTAVILCAKEHGYQVIHTHSDTQRTPHKLDYSKETKYGRFGRGSSVRRIRVFYKGNHFSKMAYVSLEIFLGDSDNSHM